MISVLFQECGSLLRRHLGMHVSFLAKMCTFNSDVTWGASGQECLWAVDHLPRTFSGKGRLTLIIENELQLISTHFWIFLQIIESMSLLLLPDMDCTDCTDCRRYLLKRNSSAFKSKENSWYLKIFGFGSLFPCPDLDWLQPGSERREWDLAGFSHVLVSICFHLCKWNPLLPIFLYDLVVLHLRWLDAVFVPSHSSHFVEVASNSTWFPALGLRRFVLKNCSGNGTRLNDQLLQAAASKRHRGSEGWRQQHKCAC